MALADRRGHGTQVWYMDHLPWHIGPSSSFHPIYLAFLPSFPSLDLTLLSSVALDRAVVSPASSRLAKERGKAAPKGRRHYIFEPLYLSFLMSLFFFPMN